MYLFRRPTKQKKSKLNTKFERIERTKIGRQIINMDRIDEHFIVSDVRILNYYRTYEIR